jgi:alpha-tubulin suppressor-like RCC1 family protein
MSHDAGWSRLLPSPEVGDGRSSARERWEAELLRIGVAGSDVLGCGSDVVPGADTSGVGSDVTQATASGQSSAPTETSSDANDTTTAAAIPHEWSVVAIGEEHGCGVDELARLFCWGNNANGQLGLTGTGARGPTEITTPMTNWITVAAGRAHTCAISDAHELWCFGKGDTGTLGTGSLQAIQPPTRVESRIGWASIAGFDGHSCAVDLDDSAWCWGTNDHAQVGVAASAPIESPLSLGRGSWTALVGGSAHTCGLTTDTFFFCWGWNSGFRLGPEGDGADLPTSPQDIDDVGISISSEVSGTYAIIEQGMLRRWGGFAGIEPVEFSNVGRREDWRVLSTGMGRAHTCIIDADAALWCIGGGEQGQLGDGASMTAAFEPTPIAEPGPWRAVATGGDQTCAIRDDDASLWCWGAFITATQADVCGLDPGAVDRTRPVAMCPGA